MVASAAMGQRIYSPDFSIGVKAGATLSEMSWQPSVKQGFTPGFTLGVVCRYTEEKLFGLIGELNITQRGWNENYDKNTGLKYQRHFTYLQLPVMTHVYFGSKTFRGFVNLGPEVGYMIGDHISSNFDYANASTLPNYPPNRRTEQLDMKVARKFDYGIAAGVGAEYRLHCKHSMMVEGRFYYGLGSVFPSSRSDTFGASRGMSIEITAAYMFRVI